MTTAEVRSRRLGLNEALDEAKAQAPDLARAMTDAEAAVAQVRARRAAIIAKLRDAGASWEDVGSVLGVTRQRAQKFGSVHNTEH